MRAGTGVPVDAELMAFRAEHPAVVICRPTPAHARWRAFIDEGTVPGDRRAMVITDTDFREWMGRLTSLFRHPRARSR